MIAHIIVVDEKKKQFFILALSLLYLFTNLFLRKCYLAVAGISNERKKNSSQFYKHR